MWTLSESANVLPFARLKVNPSLYTQWDKFSGERSIQQGIQLAGYRHLGLLDRAWLRSADWDQ